MNMKSALLGCELFVVLGILVVCVCLTSSTTIEPTPTPPTLNTSSITSHNNSLHGNTRNVYPGCKSGSGGLCVPKGKCPDGFKDEIFNAEACNADQECCYTAPDSATNCADKGGECVKTERCGNSPRLKSGTECDYANGYTCCIWTF